MPSVKIGRNAWLEVRAGGVTGGSAEWAEVGSVTDLTVPLTKESADVTARDSEGWKQELPITKAARVEFTMVWRATDAARDLIIGAWDVGSTLGVRVLDAENGQGLEGDMEVLDVSQPQPIGGAITATVVLMPKPGSGMRWVEALGVPSAAATSAADQGGSGTAWTNPSAGVTENGAPATVALAIGDGSTALRFAIPATTTQRRRAFLRIKCSVTTAGDAAELQFTTPITAATFFNILPTGMLAWQEVELTPLALNWEATLAAGFNIDISAIAGPTLPQTFTIDDVRLRLA